MGFFGKKWGVWAGFFWGGGIGFFFVKSGRFFGTSWVFLSKGAQGRYKTGFFGGEVGVFLVKKMGVFGLPQGGEGLYTPGE